jgi:hypothetical protein
MARTDIEDSDKIVLMYLADAIGRGFEPTIACIASDTGRCQRTAIRSIQRLEQERLIRVDRGLGGTRNTYAILTPIHDTVPSHRDTSSRNTMTPGHDGGDSASPNTMTARHADRDSASPDTVTSRHSNKDVTNGTYKDETKISGGGARSLRSAPPSGSPPPRPPAAAAAYLSAPEAVVANLAEFGVTVTADEADDLLSIIADQLGGDDPARVADESIRRLRVAVANADQLEADGKLTGSRSGYILKSVKENYRALGKREPSQADRREAARQRQQAEQEREWAEHETAVVRERLDKLEPDARKDVEVRALATLPETARTAVQSYPDPLEVQLYRDAVIRVMSVGG